MVDLTTLEPGRYFLEFADPHPKVVSADSHPGWKQAASDYIAQHEGADVAIVGGGPTWDTPQDGGAAVLVWGVLVDVKSRAAVAAQGAGELVPAQVGLVAVSVAVVVAAIAAAITLPIVMGDLVKITQVTADNPSGPWSKVAAAARTSSWAFLVFGVGYVLAVALNRRGWSL